MGHLCGHQRYIMPDILSIVVSLLNEKYDFGSVKFATFQGHDVYYCRYPRVSDISLMGVMMEDDGILTIGIYPRNTPSISLEYDVGDPSWSVEATLGDVAKALREWGNV